MTDRVDWVSQNIPIPRSPDGDNKMERFFFISICMNTYLLKGPLIELSLGGKKEEKKGKWEKKKK